MKQPQINELCEEVMSQQSKTPRTDMIHQIHDEAAKWVEKSAGYMELLALASNLESELTRLAEVERERDRYRNLAQSNLNDANAAESALLQAREDARRYQKTRTHARMIANSSKRCTFIIDLPGPKNEYGVVDPGIDANLPECFDAAIDAAMKGTPDA